MRHFLFQTSVNTTTTHYRGCRDAKHHLPVRITEKLVLFLQSNPKNKWGKKSLQDITWLTRGTFQNAFFHLCCTRWRQFAHVWKLMLCRVKPLPLLEANTSNFITSPFRINKYFQNNSPIFANLYFSTRKTALELCGYRLATQATRRAHWVGRVSFGVTSVPIYGDAIPIVFRDHESCTTIIRQKMFSKMFTESEKSLN